MPISGYFDTVFALAGDLTPVPDAVQPSGSVSYAQGWGPYYAQDPLIDPATAIFIDRAQTNQLFNDVTTAIQQLQQNSVPPFITSAMNGGSPFSYHAGARVVLSGIIYESKVASNTTTPPGADWQAVPGNSGVVFSGGTSGGSANVQTVTSAQDGFTNTAGNVVTWLAGFSNTLAMTLNVDGAGAVAVKKTSGTALVDLNANDIVVNQEYMAISDGTSLNLINPSTLLQASQIAQPTGGLAHSRKILWASTSTLNVSASSAILKNSAGLTVKVSNPSVTLNSAASGANGLDTGALAASTWYYVWGIYNPTTATFASLMSLSSSAPTLPAGYTYSLLLGVARTDGSNNFIGLNAYGNDYQYAVGSNLSALPILVSGVTGSETIPTYVAVSTSNAVPPIGYKIKLSPSFQFSNGGILAPNANYGATGAASNTPPMQINGSNGGSQTCFPFDLILESSNVYVAILGGGYIACLGFYLNI